MLLVFTALSIVIMFVLTFTYKISFALSFSTSWIHYASSTFMIPFLKTILDLYSWYYVPTGTFLYRSPSETAFSLLHVVCLALGILMFLYYYFETVLYLPALQDAQFNESVFQYDGTYYAVLLHFKLFAAGICIK